MLDQVELWAAVIFGDNGSACGNFDTITRKQPQIALHLHRPGVEPWHPAHDKIQRLLTEEFGLLHGDLVHHPNSAKALVAAKLVIVDVIRHLLLVIPTV